MASVIRDKGGKKRIQFVRGDDRPTIRLGKCDQKSADVFRSYVEALVIAQSLNQAINGETARWLADLSDKMYERLVRVDLVQPRVRASDRVLGPTLEAFFSGLAVKPATLVRMEQVRSRLLEYFGEDRELVKIVEADAERWRAKLAEDGYSRSTISRTVLYARQMFRWAIRRGLANHNPFLDLRAGAQVNTARQAFIDRETISRVIEAAPDAEWRALIVLSRFGGLRVPSEALALRWADVDWANNRFRVRSFKTEHHEGKGDRVVPLFPEVRGALLALFDAAPEGAEWVIERYREGANLNPQLRRIVRRAGFEPWERTWHNLRASRQTELAAVFPLHTVCAWIGNTKAIAAGHYLQVTDADWFRATESKNGAESGALETQNEAQREAATHRQESHKGPNGPTKKPLLRVGAKLGENSQKRRMGRAGLEPATPAFSMLCSTN